MRSVNVQSLDEAKALYRAEKTKVASAFQALIGSPVLVALFAALFIAFATKLIVAPDRLATIGGFNVAAIGLPPLDFGLAGEAAQEAGGAAVRQGAGERAAEFIAQPGVAPALNGIGAAASFAALIWSLLVQAGIRKRKALAAG